jgi:class 3 adenylate cyclase/tetratricopeptide (TPR) repeat protein
MPCPQCQRENRPQAKFCEECGASLARSCGHCGAALSTSAKFCSECGRATGIPPEPEARFASPHAYTPKHLAEKILTSRSALEGERKQVTVLFADLKGSMELLADRDPDDARRLLDPVLERMMAAVHWYEGTVNQVMGDGIMALFGAPLAHEDHAVRACYAALRMQESLKEYTEEVLRREGVLVQIRIGMNSGEVVVRSVGSDLRMDYTAVGQTTHIAARIEQMATPSTTLIAAATMRFVEGYVQVRPLGACPVRGLAEPLEVFELVGAGTARSRLQAAAARALTKFVGRRAEIEHLAEALALARQGRGQVAAVVAEPGMGKSRLCAEFLHSTRTQGCLILETGCISYRRTTAYLPVIELLRTYFQIEPRDDAGKILEKVTGRLLSLDLALEAQRSALLWLLDVPVEDAQWQGLDPRERGERTREILSQLFLRESQVHPLVVVVEDLHWVDTETQAFLDSFVDRVPTARLLLLVNYRPDYRHPWGGRPYSRELSVEPLAFETAEELLEMLLGRDPVLESLKRLLIEKTDGNPFFLEESVRALQETRVLVGERGALRLTRAIDDVQVPPTVQAILAARIDRLSLEEKRLLQSAAVVGTRAPFALLREVAEEATDEDLRHHLTRLVSAEFLYESRLFPDLEYTFRHALTHDVTYGSLVHDRRRALHARLVGAIERIYANRLLGQVERLAHHAFRGEVWDKAVTYARQAGTKAHGRSASREAVAFFEQALQALGHLPETRETQELAIDIRFDHRGSLYTLGEFEKMMTRLHEAESLAQALDDPLRLGWVWLYIGEYFRQTGRFADACALGERACALADKLQNLPLQFIASHYLGLARHAVGDYRRAATLLRAVAKGPQADVELRGFGRTATGSWPGFLAVNLAWLSRCLAECGEFEEGMASGGQALAIAEGLDNPYSLVAASIGIGYIRLVKGEPAEVITVLERACTAAHYSNLTLLEPQALRLLGNAYLLSGRIDEGLSLVRRAVEEVESKRLLMQHATVVAMLGEACLLAGRLDEASAAAERALGLARQRGQRGDEAVTLRLLGDIAARRDPPGREASEHHYRAALNLAADLGMRPLAARCHLGLGTLLKAAGTEAEAQEHRTMATTMFREMDMGFWLAKAG